MADLNLNVGSIILFRKNDNNSFFHSILIFRTVLKFIKFPGPLLIIYLYGPKRSGYGADTISDWKLG
jgi:hypothetical protein